MNSDALVFKGDFEALKGLSLCHFHNEKYF